MVAPALCWRDQVGLKNPYSLQRLNPGTLSTPTLLGVRVLAQCLGVSKKRT